MRRLVLVEIEAETPLAAERYVGGALEAASGGAKKYHVHQTHVILDGGAPNA